MMPIHELLSRIRWDPEFARGEFTLGYRDRAVEELVRVRLRDLEFPPDEPHVFRCVDGDGRVHHIPFHRIREVCKDGQCIWHRPDPL